MITAGILLVLGLGILVKGADWLVEGASSLARRFGVPAIVVGLTVVAFGTSLPELVVNLLSSMQGKTDLAIGNVVGSNIANILLILGISAVIRPLRVKLNTVWKEIPLALLSALLVWIMANDVQIAGGATNLLDRIDGMVLLSFFVVFLYYTFGISKVEGEGEDVATYSSLGMAWRIAIGLGALVIGGKWAVDGAVGLATAFGVSESLIGLTVVAIGTSLPELATSAVAAYRGHVDIAVGNVVGSNIFNVFWILGVSSVIRPLPFGTANSFDAFVAVGAAFLLFLALFVGKKHHLERWQGIGFIGVYAAYVVQLVLRG